MNDRLYTETKALVCEVLEIPEEELEDQALFIEDLGIDSILIIEMKTKFEEKYGIKIEKEELSELNSLLGLVNYLSARNVNPS